ncbi:hypothetical protein BX666DRAFT_1107767 [Dichotomocladium elegans]|nr:hypothetical protein BX666DRAFT_1107767 [Dichotomocladium elegans]
MLLSAIQQIEALQKTSASNNTFPIQDGSAVGPGSSGVRAFLNELDCSQAVDIQTGALKRINPSQAFVRDTRIILQDAFRLLPDPVRQVYAVLTNANLIIVTADRRTGKHVLLYPPMDVDGITVNSKMLDRELAGEYFVQFAIQAQHFITLRANQKETRNKWVGVRADTASSSTLAARPLRNVIESTLATQQREPPPPPRLGIKEGGKIAALKTHDLFTFYQDQTGEISPLSSDDESDSGRTNFGSTSGGPTAVARPTTPLLPLKDEKHEVPTLSTPTSDGPSPMSSDVSSRSASSLARPTTPRTIEISHAVAQVAPMQAISQRTSEMMLLQKAMKPPATIAPRVSSNTNGRPPPPIKQATCPSFSATTNQSPANGPYLQQPPLLHPQSNQLQVQPQLRPQRSMPELTAGQVSKTGMGQEQGKVLYSHDQCQVFHWKSNTWYGVDGSCTIQIRQMMASNGSSNMRSCLSIEMKRTRQLYLNAWVMPSTQINLASPTDVTVSVAMPTGKETYLCHLPQPADASAFYQTLQRTHQLASASPPSVTIVQPAGHPKKTAAAFYQDDDDDFKTDPSSVPQSLRPIMQCSAKLYVQSEHSKWSSLGGNLTTRISQQQPSGRMHIEVTDSKNKKLISAIVQGRNVGQLSPKRITLLLGDDKQSIVYMVKVKEEVVGAKLYEYLKLKNQAQP